MKLSGVVFRFSILSLVVLFQLYSFPATPVEAQSLSFPAQINKSFAPISIPAGGTSILSVTIYNPNSFALNLSATPPAWTDDLAGADLSFASPNGATNNCGGLVQVSGTVLSLIGGTVPAQVGSTPGSCTVTVNVTSTIAGNHVNTIPTNTLKSTDPTGTVNVTNTTPASATLQVNAIQPPTLSKTFSPNTIWVGQTSQLTITVRNTDSNASLTQTSLTDNLPANIVIANPPSVLLTSCGGSASVTGPGGGAAASGDTSLTLNNATIAANGTCTIKVNVVSTVTGVYTNTIPANAIHTHQGVTNSSLASAPLNVQSVGVTKSFLPSNFQVGGSSTLTITLQNPSSSAYTGVGFVDNLPAGLTLVSSPSPQCGGTITSTASSLTLTGGTIPAGSITTPGTCVITAIVTSSTAASYTNSIPAGALTSDQGATNVIAGSSNITVYDVGDGLTGSKSFGPSTIALGGTSKLTINITAPADTNITNFSISDALPSGVQVDSPPAATKNANCVGSSFAPAAGDTLLTYSGASILAGKTCTLTVNITSSTAGVFTNTISPANISDAENRNLSGNISANLTVSGLSVSKAFAPSTVNPNGISTLTIKLTNTNINQLDNVSMSDTLPGSLTNGVVIAPAPNASTTCGSGTVTAAAGTQAISLSGGTIPAQVGSVAGICTITVDVIGKGTNATYTNTVPANNVSGTIHGTSTVIKNPQAASATFRILAITINVVKGFNPLTVFGGSASTLTIQLSNPNSVALSGIAFTDNLPQGTGGGMYIANPANPNVGTCGGTISATPGDTSFSFSGGSLAASANCSLTLSVSMNVNANLTNTIPVGGVTSTNGASNTQAASATLTNLPGASVNKVFGPNPILAGSGNSSTMTITIQNTGNFQLDGMGMTDTLPTGMTVASPPTASQCGGNVTFTSNSVTLANGVLAGSANCTVVVQVTAPTAGSFQNCIPANALTDNQDATNLTPACDTLTVIAPPAISKAFSPDTISAGGTSALTFTLTNPSANTVPLAGVSFTDTFPVGVTLASVPNASQCNGTVTSTANSVTLTGGSIPVDSSCTVIVSVTAAAGGTYLNTSDAVTSTNGGTGNTASDTLNVIAPPSISKTFSPDTINAGGTSTLTFTVTNPNASATLNGVAFTDAFPVGVQVANPPNESTNGCDESSTPAFAPAAGDISLSFSNGSIASGGTCTVSVDVTAAGGTHVNTSGAVNSTNGGTGNTASDTLTANGGGLSLVKSTTSAGYQSAGDTINYSYLLTNTGTITLYSPYTVTDNKTTVTCPLTPVSLAPLDTVTCTATYTVQAADVTNKSVTNTATATAQDANIGGNTVTSNQSSVTVPLESLSLIKSSSTAAYRTAGNTITYNYTLTNTGNVTLYAPFDISDDHIGSPLGTPFTCGSATSLAPGANVTCSRNYTVLAADVTAGSVTNIASASAKDSNDRTVTSNDSSVTVYAVIAPVISKAFSPATIPVGTISTLTFTITNPPSNAVTLTNVSFTDTFPSGMTVAIAPNSAQCGGTVTSTSNSITLNGGSIVPNGSCTVSANVIGAKSGDLNNTSGAVASTNGGTGNTASATLTVVSPPLISKSFSPSSTYLGNKSTLTFTVTAPAGNTVALNGVNFNDALPAGLQVANPPNASASAGCGSPIFTPSAGDTTLAFSGGTIAVDGTCILTVDVAPTAAGTYNNTTNPIASTNGGTGATSNTATLTVDQAADLSITKTDGKLSVGRGENVTYAVVVNNAGPSDVTGASVFDTFPSSLTNVTWSCTPGTGAACTASGSGNISDTVNIPAGSNVTYTVSATVSNAATTNIVNTASIVAPAGVTDSNSSNNSATDTDHLNRLTIAKSASPTAYATVGTTINYSYTITNDGTSTLSAPFSVTDDKVTPSCTPPATLAPTQSFACAASHTVTQADLDAGSITNSVSATAKDEDGDAVASNTDSKTVTATQSPSLNLVKSVVSGNPYNTVGGTVAYSYVVKNDGNVTLTGPFAVSDDKTTVTCPPTASLAPNATITCTASYSVTQNDLDSGSIVNTASASGYFGTTPVTSNTASQTVNATQDKELTLVKSITSGNPYTSTGDSIQYSYLLTNSGNVTLTGNGTGGVFTVTDDKTTVTCPATPVSLAPGDSVTCTSTYTVVTGDMGGSVVNHATAHALFGSAPVDSNQDTQTAYGSPVLAVTKDDGLSIVAPNAQLEYTLTASNNSLQDSTGIQLVDTIPNGTSFVSATNGGLFNNGTSQITWPSFDLTAGTSTQFKVKVQVADATQIQSGNITSITNQAHVQDDGTHSAGTPVQASASDTDQIAINGVKNLTGTEQAGSTTPNVLIGEILDYQINIDIPNGTINDLQAVDVLDRGLAFVGCDLTTPVVSTNLTIAQNPCTDPTALTVQAEPIIDTNPASDNAGRHITFDFGQVQNTSGSIQTLTLNYRVIVLDIQDNVDGVQGLKNHVEWIWSGGTLAGEAQGVNITEPKLTIDKTVSPGVAALGSIVTYTIEIKHASNSSAPAYDVTVTDNIPVGLTLDQTSVQVTGSSGLPAPVITTTSNLLTVYWASFPLADDAKITFDATFIGPPPVVNTASVDWSSLQIDPNPRLQAQSPYNRHSTERRYDPNDQTVNDYRAETSATLSIPHSPGTGFAPNQVTLLPVQPKENAYQSLGALWLEIPKLGVKISIVGVPLDSKNEWDLTWLSNQAGYLNGTAYPTHAGNSVITAHVYLADGLPGPFFNLSKLRYGDQIIVHLAGQSYIYQVRENRVISPKDISVFKHQDYPWLTLVTCKDYDEATDTYLRRVAVGAVLVKIQNDAK